MHKTHRDFRQSQNYHYPRNKYNQNNYQTARCNRNVKSRNTISKFIYRKISEISHIRELEWGTYRVYSNKSGKSRYQIYDKRTHRNLTKFMSYRRYLFHKMIAENCSSQTDCNCKFCILSRNLSCKQPALCLNPYCNFKRREFIRNEKQFANTTILKSITQSTQTENHYEEHLGNGNEKIINGIDEKVHKNMMIQTTVTNETHNHIKISEDDSKIIENSDKNDSALNLDISVIEDSGTIEIGNDIIQAAKCNAELQETFKLAEEEFKNTQKGDDSGFLDMSFEQEPQEHEIETNSNKQNKFTPEEEKAILARLKYQVSREGFSVEKVKLKSEKSKYVSVHTHDSFDKGDLLAITALEDIDANLLVKQQFTTVDELGHVKIFVTNLSLLPINIKKNQKLVRIHYMDPLEHSDLICKLFELWG